MKKELTHDEFVEYLKVNGITAATRTEDCNMSCTLTIPKEDKIYYGYRDIKSISSYDVDTDSLNCKIGYTYDYRWCSNWKSEFKGQLKIGDYF